MNLTDLAFSKRYLITKLLSTSKKSPFVSMKPAMSIKKQFNSFEKTISGLNVSDFYKL